MSPESKHRDLTSSREASGSKGRILIVDDEPQIRRVLRIALVAKGYEVDEASGGEQAFEKLRMGTFEVILLDINMPDISGTEVCRTIRSTSEVGIIILSARNTEADKVAALDCGANDYITKPFGIPELLARIRSVMRRTSVSGAAEELILKNLEVDFLVRRVKVHGELVHLTPKEFELLRYLASHSERMVPHKELLHAVWGPDYGEERLILRAVVKQLRKKIEPDRSKPQYLITHSWLGYQLRVPK
jgi:two-component system KDP operon response regulator KdpE